MCRIVFGLLFFAILEGCSVIPSSQSSCPNPARSTVNLGTPEISDTDSAVVRGTVSDMEYREPLPNAVIAAELGSIRYYTTRTDSLGQYEIHLTPGAYVISAHIVGFASGATETINLVAGSRLGASFELACQSLH